MEGGLHSLIGARPWGPILLRQTEDVEALVWPLASCLGHVCIRDGDSVGPVSHDRLMGLCGRVLLHV
jgi:hypothetical protein